MNDNRLDELFRNINQCCKCKELPNKIKFASECHGNIYSGIMLVSEGAYLPSIKAGRYFTRGHLRDAIPKLEEYCYLTDVIKCDSCGNKTTKLADRCFHFLLEEISILKPKVILAVGRMPFEKLYGKPIDNFSKIHGTRHQYFFAGTEIIPIIHPSWANKHYPHEPRVENYKENLRRIIYNFEG